jgi:Na+/H+-translocating membrane pyrophosphatase
MAAALMTVVVPLLFFLLLGKNFIRGILAGASAREIMTLRSIIVPVWDAQQTHAR